MLELVLVGAIDDAMARREGVLEEVSRDYPRRLA